MTAVRVPDGIVASIFLKQLDARFGVKLAGGQLELAGKIFRIAHFGMIDQLEIISTLSALEMVLDELGHPVQFGAAAGAAARVFQSKRAAPLMSASV